MAATPTIPQPFDPGAIALLFGHAAIALRGPIRQQLLRRGPQAQRSHHQRHFPPSLHHRPHRIKLFRQTNRRLWLGILGPKLLIGAPGNLEIFPQPIAQNAIKIERQHIRKSHRKSGE
jgi:hypothetical protein